MSTDEKITKVTQDAVSIMFNYPALFGISKIIRGYWAAQDEGPDDRRTGALLSLEIKTGLRFVVQEKIRAYEGLGGVSNLQLVTKAVLNCFKEFYTWDSYNKAYTEMLAKELPDSK